MIEQEQEKKVKCCVVNNEVALGEKYWNDQYQSKTTGWDLGVVSPPIKNFIGTLPDKHISVLIPGCGNSYEAEYLLQQGFTNITLIDIAPLLVEKLKKKFAGQLNIKVIHGDFFHHEAKYDLIIEQTFFCALPPSMRVKYVWKMHQLLKEDGKLVGLLFNRTFDKSPPFGGSKIEYEKLFNAAFKMVHMEMSASSIAPRANSELWVELLKNDCLISLYLFNGITCSGCAKDITAQLLAIPYVLNALISSDFNHLLIVSETAISLETMNTEITENGKYEIQKLN